jgi:hypothetical protein
MWQTEMSVIDSKWYTRKQCHSPYSIYGVALFCNIAYDCVCSQNFATQLQIS